MSDLNISVIRSLWADRQRLTDDLELLVPGIRSPSVLAFDLTVLTGAMHQIDVVGLTLDFVEPAFDVERHEAVAFNDEEIIVRTFRASVGVLGIAETPIAECCIW
jgi:hypothetical protein